MFLTSIPLADLLLLAIVGVIAGHSLFLSRRGRWMLLDPLFTFWGGALVCYVFQPINFSRVLINTHGEAVFVDTLFWVLISLACVVIGYETRVGVRWGKAMPAFPVRLRSGPYFITSLVITGVGILGYAILVESAGSWENWISGARGATDWENLSGYVACLEFVLPVGITMLLFHASFHRVTTTTRVLAWSSGGLMWLWFVYLGTRSRTIMFAMVLLAAYYLPKRRNPPVWLLAVLFASLFIIVKVQEYYRGNFYNMSFHLDQIDFDEAKAVILPGILGSDQQLAQGGLSSEFNCVASVIELVPEQVPYNYGFWALEFLTRPIPRKWWPDKIYPLMMSIQGVLVQAHLSAHYLRDTGLVTGPSFTFAGHWYYTFGPLGIILGGLWTGIFFRLLRTMYDRDTHSQGNILFYTCAIPLGFSEVASTPFYWVWYWPLATLLPLLILFYFTKRHGGGRGVLSLSESPPENIMAAGAPAPGPER